MNLNVFKTHNALVFCWEALAVALPVFRLNCRKKLQILNRSEGRQLQYPQKLEPYTEPYRYRGIQGRTIITNFTMADRHEAYQCHILWFRMFI